MHNAFLLTAVLHYCGLFLDAIRCPNLNDQKHRLESLDLTMSIL